MIGKARNKKFYCLEEPNSSIAMLGKAKILNSNVCKSQHLNSNVWKRLDPQFQ